MKTIIPIFPKNNFEKKLVWTKYKGRPYVDVLIEKIKNLTDSPLVVFTDQNELVDYLSNTRIESCCPNKNAGRNKYSSPYPWDFGLIKDLIDKSRIDLQNDFLLVDIRNPFLTRQIIKEAIEQYNRSENKCLVSVKKVLDNPVQLDAYYRIVDCEMLCLVDKTQRHKMIPKQFNKFKSAQKSPIDLTSCVLSKPCFFNWAEFNVSETDKIGEIYKIFSNQFNFWARPISAHTWIEETRMLSRGQYYLFDTPLSARRIYNREDLRLTDCLEVAGISFGRNLYCSTYLLVRDQKDLSMKLYIEKGAAQHNRMLKLVPIEKKYISNSNTVFSEENQILDDSNKALYFLGRNFTECKNIPKIEPASGYFVALLESVEQGTADLTIPLQFDDGPWRCDQITNKRTNLINGKEIKGRQDFPEIYSPDGSFVIISGYRLESFEEIIADGEAEKYILDSINACKIQSGLDLLLLSTDDEKKGRHNVDN